MITVLLFDSVSTAGVESLSCLSGSMLIEVGGCSTMVLGNLLMISSQKFKKKNVNLLVSLKQFQGIPIFQTVDAIRADTFLYDFLHVTRINSVDLKLM